MNFVKFKARNRYLTRLEEIQMMTMADFRKLDFFLLKVKCLLQLSNI